MTGKDYKAMSLAYQPCNIPLGTKKPDFDGKIAEREKRRKKKKTKNKKRFVSAQIAGDNPLHSYAEKMLLNPTREEAILGTLLLEVLPRYGLTVQSQVVIKHFIVDFLIPERKLVIEVDGDIHLATRREDALRTRKLRTKGIHVLRVSNYDVRKNIVAVIRVILARCGCDSQLMYGEEG